MMAAQYSVKISFMANGIIKVQTLTLDKGKHGFNVPYFDKLTIEQN